MGNKTNWEWYVERLNLLGFRNYKQYLASAHWKAQKEKFYALQEKPYHCFLCGSYDGNFNVHHKTYKRIGMENMKKDLLLLCRECHQKTHDMEEVLSSPMYHIPRLLKKNKFNGKKLNFKKETHGSNK